METLHVTPLRQFPQSQLGKSDEMDELDFFGTFSFMAQSDLDKSGLAQLPRRT